MLNWDGRLYGSLLTKPLTKPPTLGTVKLHQCLLPDLHPTAGCERNNPRGRWASVISMQAPGNVEAVCEPAPEQSRSAPARPGEGSGRGTAATRAATRASPAEPPRPPGGGWSPPASLAHPAAQGSIY